MNNIGTVNSDNYLVKRGKQAVLFRKFDGFGVSVRALDYIDGVTVHYQSKTYTASRKAFGEHGFMVDYSGYETQLVLPRKYWDVE